MKKSNFALRLQSSLIEEARQKALERLRRLRRPLPAGFTFHREEVHER